MSGYNDVGNKAFEASAAISQYARVVMASTGTISAAGLTDQDIGVVTREAFASGDVVDVALTSKPGTHYAIADGAITAGAKVYTAASGKVSATATGTSYLRGRALDAATADGDIIEVLPMFGDTANV